MHFIGTIVAYTDRALLFQDWFWAGPDWMPKSQVTVIQDPDSMEVQLIASKWICQQKDIREFEQRFNQEEEKAA